MGACNWDSSDADIDDKCQEAETLRIQPMFDIDSTPSNLNSPFEKFLDIEVLEIEIRKA